MAGDHFVIVTSMVNRILVCYMDEGRFHRFFVHELEIALKWACHIRARWSLHPWIEPENLPAHRSELRLELATPAPSGGAQ